MPPVAPTDQLMGLLKSALEAFFASAKLGYVGYILFGLCSLGLFFFGGWLKKQEIAAAQKASDDQAAKDQAQNKIDNQKLSDNWDAARGTIDDISKENPDDGKQKRDVNGSSQ